MYLSLNVYVCTCTWCRTAATEDGKLSAQFEHQLIITETGCDILTQRLETSPPLWWEVEGEEETISS